MPPKMKVNERREKAAEAYKLFVRRVSKSEIARRIDLSRVTVAALIQEEQERLKDDGEKEDERQKAISSHEAVIRYGWEMLTGGGLKENSLNQAGILNSIISAQKAIDDITGVKAPTKTDSRHVVEHKDYANTPTEDLEELERLAQRVFGEAEA